MPELDLLDADVLDALVPGGTFTPKLVATTSNPTVTYSKQTGVWRRVGSIVTVYVRVDWSSISGGAGDLRIAGLSTLPDALSDPAFILHGRLAGVGLPGDRFGFYGSLSLPEVALVAWGEGVGTAMIQVSNAGSTGSIIVTGSYFTDDAY